MPVVRLRSSRRTEVSCRLWSLCARENQPKAQRSENEGCNTVNIGFGLQVALRNHLCAHAEGQGRIEGHLNQEVIDYNHEALSDRKASRKHGYENRRREEYGFRIEEVNEKALSERVPGRRDSPVDGVGRISPHLVRKVQQIGSPRTFAPM